MNDIKAQMPGEPDQPFTEPETPAIPQPPDVDPDPYPVTDPVVDPSPDPFPRPPEPIPDYPPDVVF